MKCIAFDLGRVVFDFDYRIALKELNGKLKARSEEVIESLFYNNFALDFEKGLVSSVDFYKRFKNTFGVAANYEEFVSLWCAIFSPNKNVIGLIRKLKIHYPLYLISNINELHFNYLYGEYTNIFSLFDGLILSFKIKSVKPEKKIYDELKTTSGYNASDILYIDDRQELIAAAEALQFICIRFINYQKLLDDLKRLHVLP